MSGGPGPTAASKSPEQLDKEWAALPSYAKRASTSHMGDVQYGAGSDRYAVAGIRPGWYAGPNANRLPQYEKLLAHEKNQHEDYLIRSGRATAEQLGRTETAGRWQRNRAGSGIIREKLEAPPKLTSADFLAPKKKKRNVGATRPLLSGAQPLAEVDTLGPGFERSPG